MTTPHVRTDQPISKDLVKHGFCMVNSNSFSISNEIQESAALLWNSWNCLEPDRYLKGANVFRYRRYGRFRVDSDAEIPVPQAKTTYFQSIEDNSYAGGIVRDFSPLLPEIFENTFLLALIMHDFNQVSRGFYLKSQCIVGVHQMRVIAAEGFCGHPTPEGIHRDGHDFNVIHLVSRENIVGGKSRIYDNNKILLASSCLCNNLDSIYLDDKRVLHDVSPILQATPALSGHRDIMTINFEFE